MKLSCQVYPVGQLAGRYDHRCELPLAYVLVSGIVFSRHDSLPLPSFARRDGISIASHWATAHRPPPHPAHRPPTVYTVRIHTDTTAPHPSRAVSVKLRIVNGGISCLRQDGSRTSSTETYPSTRRESAPKAEPKALPSLTKIRARTWSKSSGATATRNPRTDPSITLSRPCPEPVEGLTHPPLPMLHCACEQMNTPGKLPGHAR